MGAKRPFSPSVSLYLAAGQLALAAIIAAVTSTQLDQSNGDCWLNLIPGRVCDFVYATVGFSLLFTLMQAVPTVLWQMKSSWASSVPLIAESIPLALFATFWWFVMALTITIRGGQAGDAGYGGGASRSAVIAFSWLEVALFLGTAGVVAVDRCQQRKLKDGKDGSNSGVAEEENNYVYTQALARLPVG